MAQKKLSALLLACSLLPQFARGEGCAERMKQRAEQHKNWAAVHLVDTTITAPAALTQPLAEWHATMAKKFMRVYNLLSQSEIPQENLSPSDELTTFYRDFIKLPHCKTTSLVELRAALKEMGNTNTGICAEGDYPSILKRENLLQVTRSFMKKEKKLAKKNKKAQGADDSFSL
jgi:hypothetical protein